VRRVLVAVSGMLLSDFLERTLRQLDWSDAELHLLHVVDTRPLGEFRLAAGARPGAGGRAAARAEEMRAAGAEAGRRLLEEACALAARRVPAGTGVHRMQRTGVPEHEIVAAAHEVRADLIALGAAEDPEPPPPPPRPEGPGSPRGRPPFPRRHLSPTVRYVVDHAPCDVLLLYR
jgi:nucleotide-binding universal stress UspA family protein